MPVTAKLSRRFYEQFGDDTANELVDWFNQVDATYRNDLRELNELNFQRFDAKLEQRIADLRSEMHVGFANVETRFGKLENQMETRSSKLESDMETRFGVLESQMETRFGVLESQMETRFAQQRGYLEERLGAQRGDLEERLGAHVKWMFSFWLGTLLPLAGLMIALQRWGG